MAEITKLMGFCDCCQQGRLVAVPNDREYAQEELNRIATEECECPSAKALREREGKIERAEYYIGNLVPDREEHAKPLLNAAVPLLLDHQLKKMSLNLDGKIVYTIYRGADETIMVQRQETIVRGEEIE